MTRTNELKQAWHHIHYSTVENHAVNKLIPDWLISPTIAVMLSSSFLANKKQKYYLLVINWGKRTNHVTVLSKGKCFSCQLSLRKRLKMKFSHTEWGTWVRARMSVSRSVTWVSFSSLAGQCNSFSTLPSLRELLPTSRVFLEVYQHFW